jgi:hypothetical protein
MAVLAQATGGMDRRKSGRLEIPAKRSPIP